MGRFVEVKIKGATALSLQGELVEDAGFADPGARSRSVG